MKRTTALLHIFQGSALLGGLTGLASWVRDHDAVSAVIVTGGTTGSAILLGLAIAAFLAGETR
ncbi:hypothetical protein [Longispora albida]|uniref:hypothetical protein n=1 Tax=Longispora albida TaxID=203523 RepID=UPI0003A2707C|nr:hypothetical protein [Longispora albida]